MLILSQLTPDVTGGNYINVVLQGFIKVQYFVDLTKLK